MSGVHCSCTCFTIISPWFPHAFFVLIGTCVSIINQNMSVNVEYISLSELYTSPSDYFVDYTINIQIRDYRIIWILFSKFTKTIYVRFNIFTNLVCIYTLLDFSQSCYICVRPRKVVLFLEIGWVKKILSPTYLRSQTCIRIYILV